ncbi:MAG: hypothetical protein ABIP29_09645 [Candidatus Eisenbacteria bacterium]
MARRSLILATLLPLIAGHAAATTLVSTSSRAVGPTPAPRSVFADRLWDDGKAEYSVYEGTIKRYGTDRSVSAKLIVVKEDMDLARRVKSEAGAGTHGTRSVIKQNFLRDFTTGTYDYHQMSSVFLDRATGALEKLAMSSTEGCGITYVEVVPRGGSWRHVSHSYWDGEGDRESTIRLPSRHTLAEDALPVWLRRLDLKKAQSFQVPLLPSQLSGRVQHTEVVQAVIEVIGRADRHGLPVIVKVGGKRAGVRSDRYWFDPAWPHALTRFAGGADATILERIKTIRLAYWKKTGPGDERLLAP